MKQHGIPPINVIAALAGLLEDEDLNFHSIPSFTFPELNFKIKYADEGGYFVGYTTFEDGSQNECECEWNSDLGIELRKELGYYWEEEGDEE